MSLLLILAQRSPSWTVSRQEKNYLQLENDDDRLKGISFREHVLLKVLMFAMTKIVLVQIHGVVWTPALSASETELNTHSVTPAVVRTIPNTAPERERGGVFKLLSSIRSSCKHGVLWYKTSYF